MEKLTEVQINSKLKNLKGWSYADGFISKSFQFENFKETFAVMTRIAFECEAQNHHPEWKNVYNQLHISLNTHDAGGITQYDFDLANTIEKIINT